MTAKSSSALAFAALLANLAFVATGCGAFGGDDSDSPRPGTTAPGHDDAAPADADAGVKAPPVGGPGSYELTDALGIFVSPTGKDADDGNHARPLATIQAGIEAAKHAGKRVYVCTGTYREALTLADSISVIGGLDCANNEWRIGTHPTRVESPSSPAVRATDITSPTRLEGLELFAPDATAPSGSSIALIAQHSGGLVIAHTKITAGNAMKGDDGHDGIQLATNPTANGGSPPAQADCSAGAACGKDAPTGNWAMPAGAPAGVNVCVGAPGFVAQPGGFGGSGGLYEVSYVIQSNVYSRVYGGNAGYSAAIGVHNRTGTPGLDGSDGANGATTLSFSRDGYVPADGTDGHDGTTGMGGAGGDGAAATPTTPFAGHVWKGWGGAGGGAGGCPGLAGSAGKGGGASIAALLIDSPIVLDAVELVTANGGAGGLGAFGSLPTEGGAADNASIPASRPGVAAMSGGHGGASGVSGNGSSGPSIAIAHVGPKPDVRGGSKITHGNGGVAIDARNRVDAFGTTKTIPATPAGTASDVIAL